MNTLLRVIAFARPVDAAVVRFSDCSTAVCMRAWILRRTEAKTARQRAAGTVVAVLERGAWV